METRLLTIPRHGGDELRVSLDEYKGHRFLSLRTFFDSGDGIMRPTKKGCSVPLSALPELHSAIGAALRGVATAHPSTVASLAAYQARRDAGLIGEVIDPTDGGAA